MPHACSCWGCLIPYFSFPENKPLPAPGSLTEKREACLPPDHEVFRTPKHGGWGGGRVPLSCLGNDLPTDSCFWPLGVHYKALA